MKKIAAILLALCLCVGLCACGISNTTAQQEETVNYTPAEYVGIWEYTGDDKTELPHSIQLFSNGKCIVGPDNYKNVDTLPWGIAGEWMVEGKQLVVFYDEYTDTTSSKAAYNFQIVSDTEITLSGLSLTYTKK